MTAGDPAGPARVAVFGLGEAGARIAGDLAVAGVDVHAYDPAPVATPGGVTRHGDPDATVAGAGMVLAVTAAADAPTALAQALEAIPRGALYADLATASAGLKQRLAASAAGAGLGFVDVALMAPVPGRGLGTPALASGPAATRFVEAMTAVGMPVEHAGPEAGRAATRKLLRSVVMKGLAALVIESMQAAAAAGLAGETWRNLVTQLTAADEALLRRLVTGTAPHATRRLHEMEAAAELLAELGVDPVMTGATVTHLGLLAGGRTGLPPLPG
jgi:3-hydroxyisobutyrate dehydrogenase-like beta-hydroxyacid dehydrogenase